MENITGQVFEDQLPRGMGESPGAYIVEHVKSGDFYVGSSAKLGVRKRLHMSTLRHGINRNEALQKAYDKDPGLRFTFVPTSTPEAAVEYEQKLLDHHRGDPKLLNIAIDAKSSGKGLVRSEETRAKISAAGMGREAFNKGKPLSEHHHQSVIASREKLAKPVSIEGVIYPSLAEATRQLNLTLGCAVKRVRSQTDQFRNWHYV